MAWGQVALVIVASHVLTRHFAVLAETVYVQTISIVNRRPGFQKLTTIGSARGDFTILQALS